MAENLPITDDETRIGMLRLEGGLRYLGVEQEKIEEILQETENNYGLWCLTMAAVSADVLGSIDSAERPGMFQPGGPFYVPNPVE